MEIYDFVIIGGGSAGYAAVKEGLRLGLRTLLVQGSEKFGGLCIQHGCMPSKTLLESANRFHALGEAGAFGVHPGKEASFSAREIIARKQRLIDEFADDRRKSIEEADFDWLLGRAKFVDPHTIEISPLAGNQPARWIHARTILIATGSRIKKPDLPGLENAGFLTSDDVLDSERIPRSAVILGGGPVGLECAHYYNSLGVQVTVLSNAGRILGNADDDISDALQQAMSERGVQFISKARITSISRDRTGEKRVHFECEGEERSVVAAEMVSAIGREPCTAGLGLEAMGIEFDEHQHPRTLPTQQTSSCAHIFAAGDVAGPYEVLHLAVRQGEVAGRNAARFLHRADAEMETMDYRLKLQAIFTEPEMAAVGMSEKEAGKNKVPFRVASFPFSEVGRAIVEGSTAGFAKLVCERDTMKILGAAVVGPRAAELIHELVAVIYYHGTAKDLLIMPHYHPTLSEIWTSAAEKLIAASGEV